MTISFIVPVYCIENYIVQCIESLRTQENAEIEIILVDDGSKDSSGRICDEYAEKDERITVIHQKNAGVSAARNAGLSKAHGDWVCFIDGDDAVAPNLCQIFQPYLTTDYDICFFGHMEVLNHAFPKSVSEVSSGEKIDLSRTDFDEFLCAAFNRDYFGKYDYHELKLSTPCKFYRKKILDLYKIQFPTGVPTGEDVLFNLLVYRYAQNGIYLKCKPYLHRVWNESVSQKYNPSAVEDFSLLHTKLKQFIELDERPKRYTEVYNQRCIWSIGFCCLLDFCHPDNSGTYRQRKRDFISACESEMGKAAEQAKLDNFRFEKRVLFWFIQKKAFAAVNLLCKAKRKFGKG